MASTHHPANRKSGYLPSLDGWRALAIIGVMLAHDSSWDFHGGGKPIWQGWGGMGVNLFFSLSGILITTRILEEERLSGRFDIKGFYTRRLLRIQPAALVYLAAIAGFLLLGVLHDQWHYWFGALFMYENFQWTGYACIPYSFFVGHFWSLAVEEHFYILLSLLLLTIRRFRLATLLSFWLLLEIAGKITSHEHVILGDRRTYWQLDYLILPAAIAIALHRPQVHAWCVRWMHPWMIFAASGIAFFYHGLKFSLLLKTAPPVMEIVGSGISTLAHYFFPLWIVATMLHPQAWSTRALEWKPLRWVGKISYSLYLWHLLFFFRDIPQTHVTQPLLLALSGRPAKYIAAFVMASLSYYLIELPCMRLGHRLAPPKQAGRPELATPITSAAHLSNQ